MSLDASVLVPYRPDGGWRDSAWKGIEQRWRDLGVELIVESPGPGAHPGEFNHPKAINQAARRATRSTLIVADADCGWTPGLPEALTRAIEDGAAWALPLDYIRLTQRQTVRLHQTNADPTSELNVDPEWIGHGVSWAGLIAIPARDFWSIGGYDERFSWWGADDMAFGLKADTLIGPHTRVDGAVIHYWHPAPLGETYGHKRHRKQYALGERYKRAAGDVAAMQRLCGP